MSAESAKAEMAAPARPERTADAAVPDGLDALDRIPRTCGWRTPMQSRAWLTACYGALYGRDRPRLIEVAGAVGPFARRGHLLPRLLLAGAEELAEPIEPPVADPDAAESLARAVLAERLPVRFGHIPADGVFTRAFLAAARGRGVALNGPAGGSPVLRLDASWQDPLKRFSSRRRSDFRRMQRRAETMGDVVIEHLAPPPAAVPDLLARAFAVEAQGWKARSGTALEQKTEQAVFLGRYGALAAEEGRLRLSFLSIGAATAAMQIMVEEDGALWLLKIGYDESFSKASPGMLLLLDVIRNAAEDGLDRVEFLGKDAPWTAFWSEELRPHLRLRYYPYSLRGMVALAIDGSRIAAQRLWVAARARLGRAGR